MDFHWRQRLRPAMPEAPHLSPASAPRVGPAVVTGTSWSISTPRGPALPRLISKVGSHSRGQNRGGWIFESKLNEQFWKITFDISTEWRMHITSIILSISSCFAVHHGVIGFRLKKQQLVERWTMMEFGLGYETYCFRCSSQLWLSAWPVVPGFRWNQDSLGESQMFTDFTSRFTCQPTITRAITSLNFPSFLNIKWLERLKSGVSEIFLQEPRTSTPSWLLKWAPSTKARQCHDHTMARKCARKRETEKRESAIKIP